MLSSKARQIGHYVMVSLWCESLLTNTRFRFFIFEWTNFEAYLIHQEKEIPNEPGRSYNDFTNEKQNGYCYNKKQCFFASILN